MTVSVTTWIAAGLIAASLALAGVQTVRLADEKSEHAATRASYADERTKAAQAHARANDEQRAIYESRIGAKDAIVQDAQKLAASRATALADSRRTADGLRDDLAVYIARSGQAGSSANPGPGGATTFPPVVLLAELFGESDRVAGELAAAFEASRAAGLTCERSYDSLTIR